MTNEVDIVADLRPDQVDALVDRFPEQDFQVSDQAVRLAINARHQFNIIHPDSGLKLDVMIPNAGEHSQVELQRRVRVKPVGGDAETFLAAPEDIIIKKMEFYREGESEKHLRGIAGMPKVSWQLIDRSYVQDWATKLGLSEIWEQILARTTFEKAVIGS